MFSMLQVSKLTSYLRWGHINQTGSYQKDWLPDSDRKVREDHSSQFCSKPDNLLKPSDIKWENYGIFFASAGHASLIDYPDAKGLQEIRLKCIRFDMVGLSSRGY